MWSFLDKFFIVLHAAIILFILFGWIWSKTRLANLLLIAATAISWFGLGIWFGLGYCPCTDWHWQVRAQLGVRDMPHSYTKFLIDSITGWNIDAQFVDGLTLVALIVSAVASVYANRRTLKNFCRNVVKSRA